MQTLIVCKSLGSDDEISIIKKLRHFCSTASDFVYQLHINPKIIRALEDQLNPPLLGKKNERERILTDLYKLDYWIASITSRINNSDLHSVKQNLITKTNTKEFNLLDLSSLLKLPISGHKESVYRILLVNNKIISASYDHTIRVWDVSTGVCLFICKGHCGNIFSICTSGERIISGSSDSTVRIYGT
jgi:WD40 repeat protein